MKTKLIVQIAAFFGLLFVELTHVAAQTPVPSYLLVDLGTLGGLESHANGINASGQVVGYSFVSTGSSYRHAFLYTNGKMQDLGTPGFPEITSVATGINDNGQIVGYYDDGSSSFLYSRGTVQNLGHLGGYRTYAHGINASGQVVGYSLTTGGLYYHAFLYASGLMQDLGTFGGYGSSAYAIDVNGKIVGYSYTTGADYHAFLYANSLMTDLGTPNGVESCACGINAIGQIVGYYSIGLDPHAFLYENGMMQDLGTLGGSWSYAYGINNNGHVVGWSITTGSDYHAFLYANGMMRDLNDLAINAGSGWILESATAINDAGQIVGYGINPSGYEHAFRLDPLPPGWRQAIETQPKQPTYGSCPVKEAGKNSLIVVTHGWVPPWDTPEASTEWVDDMTNSITQYLTAHGKNNWQVIAYKWIQGAQASILETLNGNLLARAESEGENLGKCLSKEDWTHIHFITHSAGSALIQSATEVTKDTSPSTVVQTTFLDAYVGTLYGGRSKYGKRANWSDSYFSKDNNTVNSGQITLTSGPMDYAYNVDTTYLDIHKVPQLGFVSSFGGAVVQCYRTDSSHGWPVQFYMNTIPPSAQIGSQNLGFLVSKESDGWSAAMDLNPYRGNQPLELGTPDPTCIPTTDFTPKTETPRDISKLTVVKSPTGLFQVDGSGLIMTPQSPVWMAIIMPVTNPVNLVSFESQFIGTTNGSVGLLSVYWDTNTIGFVDERVAQPSLRTYSFGFPRTVANSSHILGFRFDPFTNTISSVMITNVTLGFAGVSESFSLSFTGSILNGSPVMQLIGPAGYTYSVEVSTNLIDWTTMAMLANTNGIVRFTDSESTKALTRFYRAGAP